MSAALSPCSLSLSSSSPPFLLSRAHWRSSSKSYVSVSADSPGFCSAFTAEPPPVSFWAPFSVPVVPRPHVSFPLVLLCLYVGAYSLGLSTEFWVQVAAVEILWKLSSSSCRGCQDFKIFGWKSLSSRILRLARCLPAPSGSPKMGKGTPTLIVVSAFPALNSFSHFSLSLRF